jgi:dihydroxy-acid dehydratase
MVRDIIRPVSDPIASEGGLCVLWGNLAPDGAIVKRSAVPRAMWEFTGHARVFQGQQDALKAIYQDEIHPGDCVVITQQGPRACGMPEMYYVTEAIASNPQLRESVALVAGSAVQPADPPWAMCHQRAAWVARLVWFGMEISSKSTWWKTVWMWL